MTPAFWYSPTLFSKKLVLPCNEIISIHSNGFETSKEKNCHSCFLFLVKKTFEQLWDSERGKQPVRDKLDVVGHQMLIHAN